MVVGSYDYNIYAFNTIGQTLTGFPVSTEGTIVSSASLGDVDEDGIPEFFIGSSDGLLRGTSWKW